MRKTSIVAAAMAAIGVAGPAAAEERPWDKWEQTAWSATCVSFSARGGNIPCAAGPLEVSRTITQNDGSGQFYFSGGSDGDGVDAFFVNGPPTYGVPGIYPFKEVQIIEPHDGPHDGLPTEMRGYCAFRAG
jgi:hypothetical protein